MKRAGGGGTEAKFHSSLGEGGFRYWILDVGGISYDSGVFRDSGVGLLVLVGFGVQL